jgi:hypothetical protein
VRTTLTLDDDVAVRLKAAARRSGASFREVVNQTIRSGLSSRPPAKPKARFRVAARDLGALRIGVSLDSIADVLDHGEGPLHR